MDWEIIYDNDLVAFEKCLQNGLDIDTPEMICTLDDGTLITLDQNNNFPFLFNLIIMERYEMIRLLVSYGCKQYPEHRKPIPDTRFSQLPLDLKKELFVKYKWTFPEFENYLLFFQYFI